jgi:hypothetical protein
MEPNMAAFLLNVNTMNRNIKHHYVKELKLKLENDEWKNNYNPIVISHDGILLDGQHRLSACVQSGLSFVCDVRLGANKEHFPEIDTGINRTPKDVLSMCGRDCGSIRAAALAMLLRYEEKRLNYSGTMVRKLSRVQLIELEAQNPDIIEACQPYANMLYKSCGVMQSTGYFTFYIFQKIDRDLAIHLFEKLCSGVGLEEGSPILALRNSLFTNKKSRSKMNRMFIAALLIKCWNDLRDGKQRRLMRFGPEEEFPTAK